MGNENEPAGPEPEAAIEPAEVAVALDRAREELRRAREDLDVFSQLTCGYWWSGEAGPEPGGWLEVHGWTSRSFTQATGYDDGFIDCLVDGAHIHSDDADGVAQMLASLLLGVAAGGRDRAVHEFRILAEDGACLWVRQRLEGRGERASRRIYASGELIAQHKRSEYGIGQVDASLLSLVEHAPNVIVTIDLAGTILFINRPIPNDDREPWELIGSSVFELTETSGVELARTIAEIATRKRAHEFGLRGAAPNSTMGPRPESARWYDVQGAPVTADGEVVAITMILTDVTERRRSEQALRRSESRWRFLWENVPDLIAELDGEGRIIVTNRMIAGRFASGTIFERISEAAATLLRDAMAQATRTGEPTSYEVSVVDEHGQTRWWSSRIVPLAEAEAEGEAARVLLIATDITDQKAAEYERTSLEAQLRQQQKLESIGTLASGVAHEINNPIQGIMNYADLVRLRAEPGGMVADFAAEIINETERVANIVRNLLAFARQEKEQHSPAHLSDILASTLTLMGAVLRRDHITLDLDVPSDLPTIECRTQQLQQVFMNLLNNARYALNARYPEYDEDKRIRVAAREVVRAGEAWVQISIEDHGVGIEAQVIGRIFDPFFTTKGRDEGTGLGLSVSHGIVRDHGGELEVESEPGSYTRFQLSLRAESGWDLDPNFDQLKRDRADPDGRP